MDDGVNDPDGILEWMDQAPKEDGPPDWATDNVVPIRAVAQREADQAQSLPLQYFDDIEMQLTGLWLIKHLLPAVGIAVLYGHPGSGKTFLALDWALHVALGWDWHGRKVRQGLVVYLCAEGVSGLRNRVEAFRRHHDVHGIPFALIPVGIDLQAPDADVNRLIAAIREAEAHFGERAAAVFIDTISKTFGAGKENTDDMVTYVGNCQRVASEFECLTVPVHHRPKDSESEDPRGHSSLKGGAETVVIVEAGETKRARITKQKDGEDGIEMLFKLKVVELGQDEDGETVTSCIVEATDVDLVPRGDSAAQKASKLPDGAKHALNLLDETLEQVGFYPPAEIPDAEINRLKVGKVVHLDDWRQKYADAAGHGPDIKPDSLAKAFRRALPRLQNDGIVRVWRDYAWRTWENRTVADTQPDTIKNQDRTSRTNGVPPTGETPAMSGSLSEAPRGDVRPAWSGNPLFDPEATSEPPAWMDEAPPWHPDEDDREFGADQ